MLTPEDPAVVVALLGSAQIGKTFIAEIFIGASLDLDPGQILYVQATEPNAVKFARTKWRPMIRATPRLGELFDLRQSKEGGNSTLYQERKDGRGSIMLTGANSAASLSMISVRRQVQDDLSKWEKNTAGDPENQADSRSKAYLEMGAKILKIGTPLLKGSCRISRAVANGSDEHYHVPCPHCRHLHPLEPENFVENVNLDDPAAAHFTCPECDGAIEYKHRAWMVDPANGAGWVPHNPAATDYSFTLWAAYAGLESWSTMAKGYAEALGDPEAEQVWWNDTAGRPYELPGEAPPWEDLKKRGDAGGRQLGQVPPGALLLTLTLDVQDEFVDGVVVGWGRNLTRWVIARTRVEGFIGTPECRAELRRLVEFEWPTFCGTKRAIDLAGVDANAWTDEVFDWAKNFPKSQLIMTRGLRGDAAPTLSPVRRERRHDGRVVKYQGRFFNIGVNQLKGALYKFLRVETPGMRGYVDFPAGLDDDYYEQLTAEKRTPDTDKRGFTVFQWVKPRALRNEQLDVMVYGQALATKLGWRVMTPQHWDRLSAIREKDAEKVSDEHAGDEFWYKENSSTPADAVPAATPTPSPPPPAVVPPPRPVVIRSRTMGPRRF